MIGDGYDTYGWAGRIPFGGCETLVYGYVAVVGRATGALVDGGEIGGGEGRAQCREKGREGTSEQGGLPRHLPSPLSVLIKESTLSPEIAHNPDLCPGGRDCESAKKPRDLAGFVREPSKAV